MDNRRQTFRQSFNPEESLRAELYLIGHSAPVPCELLDLSLGGMRVRLRQAVPLSVGDSLTARLLGRDFPEPVVLSLALPSRVVYLEEQSDDYQCGVNFLPTADPATNEQIERTLMRFLLAEQRRKLRKS